MARTRIPPLAAGIAAGLAVVVAAAWWVVLPPETAGRALATRPVVDLPLPWPAEGQASVEVQNLGSLGSRGEQRPVPIASVTKVMTAYVVLKDHPLGADEAGPEITVDEQAEAESTSAEESSAPVRAGRRFSERDLLALMLIPSGNNVARLLARWDAGSQDAFVAKMNREAAALGMTSTTYTGASGVEDSTTSTATDQLRLAREAMKHPVIRAIVATPSLRIDGVPGTVANTNTLLGRDGVIGLKTGSSTAAGGALMWAARAGNGALILGVVLQQRPGGTPSAGLRAVLETSATLIAAIQRELPAAVR
ncbi:D-alanyl-D-alanine carboxypeptidase family protein [Amycolatopsis tolypomycina]|uniref:D-alanyl-D-alanine carboxypeptidase (Penicillin-binding protein 5/6) n=1 Tax=Amycolatopsis tolypomycina TaxID=208445 RepID=A0A1H4WDT6_9PSEU|nr:serine hydrolase [Amycolatopsis tolypomycina]SEC91437.1 D-alanyl-D-alanine carboxypeptidase (penicillin-binding protein 5/6) [Amycolatopsis tolypomycina]